MTATIEAKQDLVKTKFNDVVIGKDHIFLLSDRSIDIYEKESKKKKCDLCYSWLRLL